MSQINHAGLSEGAVFQERYRIIRCLKAGGMGAVYECEHLSTQKRRALKVMLPQVVATRGMRERFELEARITARIESDHIVETFDAGVDPETGSPFLVMELLRGEDLESTLQTHGPFSAPETVALLAQVALALDKTHAAGIIHRDLKPQNLFLTTRDDGAPRVKVLDFGIAKVVADGTKTAQQTAAIGTPLFMSVEQTTGDGRIGPQADTYALGHIAYALLVGAPYWLEEQLALPVYTFLSRMIAGPIERPTARAARRGVTLPPAFDKWFRRATARDPTERFARASTLVAELADVMGTPPPRQLLAAPPVVSQRLSQPAPAPFAPEGASSAVMQTAPPLAVAGAGGSWSTGTTALPEGISRPRAARAWLTLVAVGSVLAFALVAVVGVRSLGGGSTGAAPPGGPVGAANTPAAPTLQATSSAAVTVEPAPSPPEVAPSSTAPASASAPPRPPRPVVGAPVTTAAPQAPPAGKKCDPPYTIDAKGHHHPKPECL